MRQESFKTDQAAITIFLDGPLWNNLPTATLGGFRSRNAQAGQTVLSQAIDFARTNGVGQIIGPMEGDTWHSYRFVTDSDGSPPFLMEPTNQAHELDVFKLAGFRQIGSYFSARVPLEQMSASKPTPTDEFKIEIWDGKDAEGMFQQVYDLSVAAFANNPFYKAITRNAFMAMYMPIVPLIRKDLVLFARKPDGALTGFLFGIPNYVEAQTPKSVILKTYASLTKGAGRHLSHTFHKAAAKSGFETAIHALIHDDNLSALRSAAEGAEVFRRYGLFGLRLNG